MENLGKTMRLIRVSCDVAQAELSQYMGLSQSALSNFENGKYTVSIEDLEKFCGYFDITMVDLFYLQNIVDAKDSSHHDGVVEPENGNPMISEMVKLIGKLYAFSYDLKVER